jgi:hypothetical protein
MPQSPTLSEILQPMEEADSFLSSVSISIFLLAAGQVIGFLLFLEPAFLLAACGLAVAAFLLRQYQSRVAALVMAALALANFIRVIALSPRHLPSGAWEVLGSLLRLVDGLWGSGLNLCAMGMVVTAAFRYHSASKAFETAVAQAEKDGDASNPAFQRPRFAHS